MSDRDLFANFDRMRREMDELFGDVFERTGLSRRRGGFSPPVDVAYTSDPPCAIVTAELAGVEINQQVEIERGGFRRIVELAADVQAEQAKANYEDGMLRIELPLVASQTRSHAVPIEPAEKQ